MVEVGKSQYLSESRNIGIFGLSANPPTYLGGHGGIVKYFVDLKEFDELWILPVYRHSFSSKRYLERYEHRVAMCELNFEHLSSADCPVRVMPLERDVYSSLVHRNNLTGDLAPIRMGSVDVLLWVRERLPSGSRVSLILGGDTYRDLAGGKWKRADE